MTGWNRLLVSSRVVVACISSKLVDCVKLLG